MAQYTNISLEQGAGFKRYEIVKDEYGVALDLTGYTIAGSMCLTYYDYNIVPIFPIEVTIHDTKNGVIQLKFGAGTTIIMDPGNYIYTVDITDESFNVTRVLKGIITLNPGIELNIIPPVGAVNQYQVGFGCIQNTTNELQVGFVDIRKTTTKIQAGQTYISAP